MAGALARLRRPGPVIIRPDEKLNPKQREALDLLFGTHRHTMLYGGARSGKTFISVWATVKRGLVAEASRHAIFRHRFNHLKRSIGLDTLPKVMATCYPGIRGKMNSTDWYYELPNGSEIWLCGLDDKDRTEKILGMEFATLYFNECSQIGHQAVRTARTRLAQNTKLPLRAFYDCNPPSRNHWSYKEFIEHRNPVDNEPLRAEAYGAMLMNPTDNPHLPPEFLEELASLPLKDRLRFLEGKFATEDSTMLWTYEVIKRCTEVEDLEEVAVSIDPSGSEAGDKVGIVGAGRAKGRYYVLADESLNATPDDWARKAIRLYDDLGADVLIGERNFGGDMVKSVVEHVARDMKRKGERTTEHIAYRDVVSSRGKALRAEPVSALYSRDLVRHVGKFDELEDEMTQFSTSWNRKENGSPNRVDALVFSIAHLMGGVPGDRSMSFGSISRGRF